MLKKIKKNLLLLIRRIMGIEELLKQINLLNLDHEKQQKQLIALGNGLISFFDPKNVRTTRVYNRCEEIVSLLSPMDIKDGKYLRIGRKNDGGYVLLDNFSDGSVKSAYSFGISNDVSWDEDIANLGIDVFMFDHTTILR